MIIRLREAVHTFGHNSVALGGRGVKLCEELKKERDASDVKYIDRNILSRTPHMSTGDCEVDVYKLLTNFTKSCRRELDLLSELLL